MGEMRRVVVPGGRMMMMETWQTPFLMVHGSAVTMVVGASYRSLDALATMIDEERETYERWLKAPEATSKSDAQ